MNKKPLLLLTLLLCPPQVLAQTLKSFPADTLKETGRVFSAPFHLSAGGAALAAGIVAADLGAYSLDERIRREVVRQKSSSANGVSNVFEKFGNGAYDLPFLLAYGGAGKLFGNDYMEETAILAGESFLAANAAGTLLKVVAGRARPYDGKGNKHFLPFNMKTSGTSFPSGHTVTAFSIASVFASRADSGWVAALAYLLASGVAAQRVYTDKHWTSDVVAGAAIGTLVGRDVVRNSSKSVAFSVLPADNAFAMRLKF